MAVHLIYLENNLSLVLSFYHKVIGFETQHPQDLEQKFTLHIKCILFMYIMATKDESIMKLVAKLCFEVLTTFDSLLE